MKPVLTAHASLAVMLLSNHPVAGNTSHAAKNSQSPCSDSDVPGGAQFFFASSQYIQGEGGDAAADGGAAAPTLQPRAARRERNVVLGLSRKCGQERTRGATGHGEVHDLPRDHRHK